MFDGHLVELAKVGPARVIIGMCSVEARGPEFGKRAVEAVAVGRALGYRIDADGEEGLAVDQGHTVVTHRHDPPLGRLLDEDIPTPLHPVAGEVLR